MRIQEYDFGRIVVDGRTYTSDLLLLPARVVPGWWRREGHRLALEDLTELLGEAPRVLIVGTGRYGRMVVPEETRRALEERSVQLEVHDTAAAVRSYNARAGEAGVAAALHLTC